MGCFYCLAPPLFGSGVRAISAVKDTAAADWFPLVTHACENATCSISDLSKRFNINELQIFRAEIASKRGVGASNQS